MVIRSRPAKLAGRSRQLYGLRCSIRPADLIPPQSNSARPAIQYQPARSTAAPLERRRRPSPKPRRRRRRPARGGAVGLCAYVGVVSAVSLRGLVAHAHVATAVGPCGLVAHARTHVLVRAVSCVNGHFERTGTGLCSCACVRTCVCVCVRARVRACLGTLGGRRRGRGAAGISSRWPPRWP